MQETRVEEIRTSFSIFPYLGVDGVFFVLKKSSIHLSCEFDKSRIDTNLCKLRDTPAARLSYGSCQG